MEDWEKKYKEVIEKNEKSENEQNQGCLAAIVFVVIMIIFGIASAYGQTYYMDYGQVNQMPVTFSEGSYINIEGSTLELNVTTHTEPRYDTFNIVKDEMYISNGRTVRELRMLSDRIPSLRIHTVISASSESVPIISVNVYDMETQVTTQYVIYTSP